MSRSVLLQLARDSIHEVLQAKRKIDKTALLKEHPLLNQIIKSNVTLYLDGEKRGFFESKEASKTLLEDIIYNAKKAAFNNDDFPPITILEYMRCELGITLDTPEGVMSQKDLSILENNPEYNKI